MKIVAAFIAGAATVLTFSPFGYFPFGIAGPALLFYLWLDAPPGRAFLLGLSYGFGLFGFGVSWVYVSMHVYGHMPTPLAGLAVLIFVLLLSLYVAAAGLVQTFFGGGFLVRCALVFPALWTLIEWLRGWLWTGFPWLSLGYGQIETGFSGLAQWLGVYGVSWASATVAGLLAAAAGANARCRFQLLAIILVIWAASWAAGHWSWVHPSGKSLRVAVVQGNVPLVDKWEPAQRKDILMQYVNLSAPEVDADLIIWPEAALPFYLDSLPDDFWDVLEEHPADFMFGILERVAKDDAVESFNSVASSSGQKRSVYRKQHLVPFGEFLPLPSLLGWLIDNLEIPMSDFSAWRDPQQTISVAGVEAGVSICYEDAFADEVRQSLPTAALLINVSEDSWFGDSLAPHQRLDMARMRALENGRPMVRAANTGVSSVIAHSGTIIARTEQFVRIVLRAEVQPMQGTTPFSRFGSWPIVTVCIIVLFFAGLRPLGWRRGSHAG